MIVFSCCGILVAYYTYSHRPLDHDIHEYVVVGPLIKIVLYFTRTRNDHYEVERLAASTSASTSARLDDYY